MCSCPGPVGGSDHRAVGMPTLARMACGPGGGGLRRCAPPAGRHSARVPALRELLDVRFVGTGACISTGDHDGFRLSIGGAQSRDTRRAVWPTGLRTRFIRCRHLPGFSPSGHRRHRHLHRCASVPDSHRVPWCPNRGTIDSRTSVERRSPGSLGGVLSMKLTPGPPPPALHTDQATSAPVVWRMDAGLRAVDDGFQSPVGDTTAVRQRAPSIGPGAGRRSQSRDAGKPEPPDHACRETGAPRPRTQKNCSPGGRMQGNRSPRATHAGKPQPPAHACRETAAPGSRMQENWSPQTTHAGKRHGCSGAPLHP